MIELAAKLWDPWLAIAVVAVAGLVTLVLGGRPLTAWPALRGMLRGRPDEDPPPFGLLLAASAGLGGIAGSALAIAFGGPGAVIWSWLAIALGLGLHFLEGVLGYRKVGDRSLAEIHLLSAPLGKILAPFFAAAVIVVAIVVGSMVQTHEAAGALRLQSDLSATMIAIAIAVVAVPCVFASGARRLLFRLLPLVLAGYAIAAIVVAFGDPLLLQMTLGDGINQAFGVEPLAAGAAGGTVALAVHHGVLRAALGGGTGGLGAAALAGIEAERPVQAGAVAMLAALASAGVLSVATGLVVLGGGSGRMLVAQPQLVMLEHAQSRGLLPHTQVGQTIVLPRDTPLEDQKHYAMLLRANPRGHAWGKLDKEKNVVVLPHWQIAEQAAAVIFRSRDPERAKQAAWDVRIPCTREVIDAPNGQSFLRLAPVDSTVDMHKLVTHLELDPTPHIEMEDFAFVGRVAEATAADGSDRYLAMYEPPNAERADNPKLHEFFRTGYRGPYPDDAGAPRPPWALVGAEGFVPPIGQVLRLRLATGPRGAAAVAVTRSGSVEGPAWNVLMQARALVLRHADDPARDVQIPVTPRLDGARVRFDVADARFEDMRTILDNDPQLSGPFVVTPDVEVEVEVRSDARLPAELAGRRVLVPLHEHGEPHPATLSEVPVDPHPGLLLQAGYAGPFLSYDGAEIVADRFDRQLGWFGRAMIAIVVVVLAVASIAAHGELGARAATALLGPYGATLCRAGCVIAAACGTIPDRWSLLGTASAALAALLVVSLLGLVLSLPRARKILR